MNPFNLDHIIAGSETGGVWKSLDAGSTWTVLSDNLSNIDVYALAMDPSNTNIYYWGSTNGVIFKSSNAGATWSPIGNVPGGTVNKILIDPINPLKLYASAQGSGLFKSTNGGSSWNSIAPGVTSGYDFEFKPNSSNDYYWNYYVRHRNG